MGLYLDNDLKEKLPHQDFPWLANLSQCFFDQTNVEWNTHPVLHPSQTYVRRMKVGYIRNRGKRFDWQVTVTIWSRDIYWLVSLTDLNVGTLINIDTSVR